MKIERISENQIKCTLNKSDLASRQLMLTEFAYGTEKAKAFFRDMMEQASDELGFEAEDIPLMIEAVPVNPDCIVLIITKVEDPEELDTRFSRFAPVEVDMNPETDEDSEYDLDEDEEEEEEESSNDITEVKVEIDGNNQQDLAKLFGEKSPILDAVKDAVSDISKKVTDAMGDFVPLPQTVEKVGDSKDEKTTKEKKVERPRILAFSNLEDACGACRIIMDGKYDGNNTLYKDEITGKYYLVLFAGEMERQAFRQLLAIALEYGEEVRFTYAIQAYYEEHYKLVVKNQAVKTLAAI